jgi:hypothetical protein
MGKNKTKFQNIRFNILQDGKKYRSRYVLRFLVWIALSAVVLFFRAGRKTTTTRLRGYRQFRFVSLVVCCCGLVIIKFGVIGVKRSQDLR